MKSIFDHLSLRCSRFTTNLYSTSFSLGIRLLAKKFHDPIYAIYGFVRLADEIVDSFDGFPQKRLLTDFRNQTYQAIEEKISLNPILNSFQFVVHQYGIERELIDIFLDSMEMDLHRKAYHAATYEQYILGSAQVVGLMCLRVFTEGDEAVYRSLKTPAMKLGAAFQKVNFLRDLKNDTECLGRTYFPQMQSGILSCSVKRQIEDEIAADFEAAGAGIVSLPVSSRRGVYLAYIYYKVLFDKIKRVPPAQVLAQRIRVPNAHKISLLIQTVFYQKLSR